MQLIIFIKDYEKNFKEIFEDEKTFERCLNHTNSLYNLNHIFGSEIKIGFLFENEEGAKKVFQDLIEYASKDDKEGKIIVSFIKGISKKQKYDYRVMITGKVDVPVIENNIIVNMATRFHQMNCIDDRNISILEEIISHGNNPQISILPMTIHNEKIIPLWEYEIHINKVNIKQAYEIGKNDLEAAAILKTDDPIIPVNIDKVPIKELLELKKSFE